VALSSRSPAVDCLNPSGVGSVDGHMLANMTHSAAKAGRCVERIVGTVGVGAVAVTETERVKGTLGAVTGVAVGVGVGAATVCGTSMGMTSSPILLLVGAATATARLSPPLLRESLWRDGWTGLSGLVWVDGRGGEREVGGFYGCVSWYSARVRMSRQTLGDNR
jgi:hypothetical protein